MSTIHYLVPTHSDGVFKDLVHTISVADRDDADALFVAAKDRLWRVNGWGGGGSVAFRLTDAHGNNVNRIAHKNDHIRITSGNTAESTDWVVVDAIEYDDYPDDDMETFAIRVHPAADSPEHVPSGTFVIERCGCRLSAAYHGRNEVVHSPGGSNAWHNITDQQWLTIIRAFIE